MTETTLPERDDVTLRVLAIIDRTTVAEQRREAVRAYCRQARTRPDVAEIVRLMLAARRARRNGGSNVIAMEGRR